MLWTSGLRSWTRKVEKTSFVSYGQKVIRHEINGLSENHLISLAMRWFRSRLILKRPYTEKYEVVFQDFSLKSSDNMLALLLGMLIT